MEYINFNWSEKVSKKFFEGKKRKSEKSMKNYKKNFEIFQNAMFFLKKIREQKMPVSS